MLATKVLSTLAEFAEWREPWRDLWLRSNVSTPLVLQPHVQLFHEYFAPERAIKVVLVQDAAGILHAGVVLFADDDHRGFTTYGLPNNDWADTGAVLINESYRDQQLLQSTLIAGLHSTGAGIIDLRGVRLDQGLLPDPAKLPRVRGGRSPVRRSFKTGMIDVATGKQPVDQAWSKNLRKNLRRRHRALAALGELEFNACQFGDTNMAREVFERGLDLENRGWKGRQGTAMVQQPKVANYYRAQVDQLFRDDDLVAFELRLDGRLIAFEYGWLTKGVYHSNKTTYDERLAKYGPGQLLFTEAIKYCQALPNCHMVDLQGEINDASSALRPMPAEVVNCSLYLSPTARLTYGVLDRVRQAFAPDDSAKLEGDAVRLS